MTWSTRFSCQACQCPVWTARTWNAATSPKRHISVGKPSSPWLRYARIWIKFVLNLSQLAFLPTFFVDDPSCVWNCDVGQTFDISCFNGKKPVSIGNQPFSSNMHSPTTSGDFETGQNIIVKQNTGSSRKSSSQPPKKKQHLSRKWAS